LATELPKRGIVITHRDFLPIYQVPYPDLFVVCIKPDRKEHPWAQHYIVQNHTDPILNKINKSRVSVIPCFWSQPSLIPRDNSRGAQVLDIAYFGRLNNLAPELQTDAWKEEMLAFGFNWQTVPMKKWNNYFDIDVTVSIRGWDISESKGDAVTDWDSKPPNKLTNSWLSNVPAIVGDEPAFRAVCESGIDSLVVKNLDELKSALLNLREDNELFRNLQKYGAARAKEFSVSEAQSKWLNMIQGDIFHAHENWMKLSKFKRQFINITRMIRYFANAKNIKDLLSGVIRSFRK
jgi:hypothetical protein